VRDAGAGLPPDFDIQKAKGLGMRIVKSLAGQIKGELGLRAHHRGTEFIVTFPL
jgi:two-component sensor histidine kinase